MNGRLDLVGLPLDDALERCKELGLAVDVLITRPVRGWISSDRLRVVRYNFVVSGEVVLTAVFEYAKKGGSEGGLQDN
ncbi:hypothetical protein L9W92_06885 [Pelotomaculum terephthalicicum JT]|uniref:hypothetical protein n=1 Tax=Pelotomaculum terephthalicicum TaxID=206393 RepID=UPI0009CB4667|nr:hypothetical protein [Pelotomaculum terephthalicicum]MCG9967778.1 hypothetical protein [Pelotomaculum terephthalicicum JT]OPX85396.1 MAG: hypothetical protein A4E54_02444 [Pelotomaculum sp. PtaB.Bin117]